ncbi:MAG: hypothetical protein IKM61_09090 [Eubacteriaceae bacterium]|nr:hypothetical protein [Eubacteriaceae bacterium]
MANNTKNTAKTKKPANSSEKDTKKAKTTSQKNNTKQTKKDDMPMPLKNEITGIILIFMGIFILFSVLSGSDALITQMVSSVAVPFFGTVGSVMFGIIIIVHGACRLFDIAALQNPKAGMYIYVLFTNILTLMSLGSDMLEKVELDLKALLSVWKSRTAGGFLGISLAKILSGLLSKTGAIMLIIAISIISFIVFFRKSVSVGLREKAHVLKEKGEIISIERKAVREQKKAELTEQKEIKKAALLLMEEEKKNKNIDDFVNHSSVKKAKNEDIIVIADEPQEEKPRRKDQDFPAPMKRKKKESAESEVFEVINDIEEGVLPHDEKIKDDIIINEPKKLASVDVTNEKSDEDDGNDDKEKAAYVFPSIDLLAKPSETSNRSGKEDSLKNAALLEKTLSNFGISAKVNQVSMGPTVTRYEFTLTQPGVRVSKILGLADDIALAFASKGVRIEAPIPGKNAIGVEVPNKTQTTVHLSELLMCEEFQKSTSPLSVALGKTITGEPLICDITKMPHLLIAGKTGSGKSVCINTIIMSILYHSSPDDVRMILIDPKMVELSVYNQIPYLLVPVVTDPQEASGALNWAVSEMQQRYEAFAKYRVKNIEGYNNKMLSLGEEKMYHVIIIIDELNDLMMMSRQSVEAAIIRLAQLARAAGIHLVLATQRPTVDVITGTIKANIPQRIAFSVSSQIDSKTILDHAGAEKLIGKGDLLYYPEGIRAQCAFVSEEEVESVVNFIKEQCVAEYDDEVYEDIRSSADSAAGNSSDAAASNVFMDDLLADAMEIAFEKMTISTSTIQRRLRIGYARAGRIIDEMEERGFVSEADGARPRNVLIGKDEFMRILKGNEVKSLE